MKLHTILTYGFLFAVYIYIVVLLFLPNTDMMGFLLLFIWFVFSHSFLFADLFQNWEKFKTDALVIFFVSMLAITTFFLLSSLVFLSVYIFKVIHAQDVSISNFAITPENGNILFNYKILFVVSEFIMFGIFAYLMANFTKLFNGFLTIANKTDANYLVKNVFNMSNNNLSNVLSTLFWILIIVFFLFFILLFYSIGTVYVVDGGIKAFEWALTISLSINFIFLMPLINYSLPAGTNITDIWEPTLIYLLIMKIICSTFYCMHIAYQLYTTSTLII